MFLQHLFIHICHILPSKVLLSLAVFFVFFFFEPFKWKFNLYLILDNLAPCFFSTSSSTFVIFCLQKSYYLVALILCYLYLLELPTKVFLSHIFLLTNFFSGEFIPMCFSTILSLISTIKFSC